MREVFVLVGFLALSLGVRAQRVEEFKTPPMEMRTKTLWYWNNATVTPEGIDEQLQALRDQAGFGGVGILPYEKHFLPTYLSEEYFKVYEHAARRAKELGMTLSLYDEFGFPSGSGGAIHGDAIPRFVNRYPALALKRLDKIEQMVPGGTTYHHPVASEGTLMGVVAMNTATRERVDLTDKVTEGVIVWRVPPGEPWQIMQFVCLTDGDPNFDYLNPAAAQAFMEMTHEAYYKRFPDLFGTTITETFYDEITLYRAQGRVWTPGFNAEYARRHGGESPVLFYPALWYDIGPQTEAARNALYTLRSDLYAEAYAQVADRWSKAHGVKATGHQDNEEIVDPVGTSADLMKCQKYQEIPGIDKIGGDRPAEKFYKIVSSSAYNWDHSTVMSETFAAMGDLPMDSMYSIVMDQYTKGVNSFITHAAWYNNRAVHFPPDISSRNPLYTATLYDFNTFVGRLSVMLRNEARFVSDVAVLYPIHTMQGEHRFDGPLPTYKGGMTIPYLDYVEVGELLSNVIGLDYQWLHPEVLATCLVGKSGLTLPNKTQYNTFQTLIIPSSRSISVRTLEQALALYERGGRVIFTGQLPGKSAEVDGDAAVTELMSTLLPNGARYNRSKAGGEVIFVEQLSSATLRGALQSERPFDVAFPAGVPLRYIHKEQAGRSRIYLANLERTTFDAPVQIRGKKNVEVWNPHTGEVYPIQATYEKLNGQTVTLVHLTLPTLQSLFLVEK